MDESISIECKENKGTVQLLESGMLYLSPLFEKFYIQQLAVNVDFSTGFEPIRCCWSYDNGQNWTNPKLLTDEDWEILENVNIAIACTALNLVNNTPFELRPEGNVENSTIQRITISSITYDNEVVEVADIKTIQQLVAQYPKWNFYDNQQVNIRRWLDQCNAIGEMYGHTVIYFKTEPVETEHTFASHVLRNVCAVKKLKIVIPGNEIPQDRNVYSEWDMPLQDDFLVHTIWEKFQQAFGEKAIPESKDYLFFPMLNKLFRVSGVQPKNGFMGKIAWWEVFLTKYEEDEAVTFDEELQKSLSGFPGMDDAFDSLSEIAPDNMLEDLHIFKTATIETKEKIQEKTIEEKKEVTQNFTNKLVDSNNYISVKETEKYREFIAKRLKIVSVNPDSSAYPITMYNCAEVEKRVIAMTYKLEDFTLVNKFSTAFTEKLKIGFNFVTLGRFSSEILDYSDGTLSHLTVEMRRNKLVVLLHDIQQEYLIDYPIEEKELYAFELEISLVGTRQAAAKLFKLVDKQKTLAYQNVYIAGMENLRPFTLASMLLYGGNYLTNDILLQINSNKILLDNANPILQMQNFDY